MQRMTEYSFSGNGHHLPTGIKCRENGFLGVNTIKSAKYLNSTKNGIHLVSVSSSISRLHRDCIADVANVT